MALAEPVIAASLSRASVAPREGGDASNAFCNSSGAIIGHKAVGAYFAHNEIPEPFRVFIGTIDLSALALAGGGGNTRNQAPPRPSNERGEGGVPAAAAAEEGGMVLQAHAPWWGPAALVEHHRADMHRTLAEGRYNVAAPTAAPLSGQSPQQSPLKGGSAAVVGGKAPLQPPATVHDATAATAAAVKANAAAMLKADEAARLKRNGGGSSPSPSIAAAAAPPTGLNSSRSTSPSSPNTSSSTPPPRHLPPPIPPRHCPSQPTAASTLRHSSTRMGSRWAPLSAPPTRFLSSLFRSPPSEVAKALPHLWRRRPAAQRQPIPRRASAPAASTRSISGYFYQ